MIAVCDNQSVSGIVDERKGSDLGILLATNYRVFSKLFFFRIGMLIEINMNNPNPEPDS